MSSPGGLTEVYEYHPTHGAVAEITRSIGSSSYELDYSFDSQGRLSQITYPTNVDAQRFAVEYLYDAWGLLSQVRNAATPSLVYYTLNAQDGSGATRRATFGNGVVEQYGYEATTGRLASIQTGPSGSATLQNLSYEWDLAGNLEQRVDQLLSRTEVFGYDALDRLQTVTRNSAGIFSATYDALGNLKTKTGVSGTYTYGSSRPHAVTSTGSLSFTYDANGNMTDRNGTEITWASYNLPTRIERSSGEYSEFLYGADRSRYQQIEGSGALQSVRHYASPGLFEVLTWNSGASRVDYHYIHVNGRAVAQFTTSNVEADELQYLHRDHQGSVVATTDTNGAVLDQFEYDPFGARTTTVGSSDRMHRGYTGHEHLEALDLIHMNGRVQDPVLGRFLSPDPLVQAPYHSQSLNRYSYVWNNPLSLVDPSGFQKECLLDNYCGDICLFFFSCQGLDFGAQLWLAETFGVEQRRPAFIFDPPVLVAQTVPAPVNANVEAVSVAGIMPQGGDPRSLAGDNVAGIAGVGLAMNILRGGVATSGVLLADDVTGVGVVDDAAIPVILGGAVVVAGGVIVYQNGAEWADRGAKYIEGIIERATPRRDQYVYTLVVVNPGPRLDVRGQTVSLGVGDVWKYGTSIDPAHRYSQTALRSLGVAEDLSQRQYGSGTWVMIQEKLRIIGYMTTHGGDLPPGNKIMR